MPDRTPLHGGSRPGSRRPGGAGSTARWPRSAPRGGGPLRACSGVGGGIVMIPLLVLRAGYRQRDAHAMSLGAIIPISLAGVINLRRGPARWRVGDALAPRRRPPPSGAPRRRGAFLTRIKERPLKLVFGAFSRRRCDSAGAAMNGVVLYTALVGFGLVTGGAAGLLGVGGGDHDGAVS